MKEIDAEEAAFRVGLGTIWLDMNVPGWADRIDLLTLRIREEGTCILGQLYGSLDEVPKELTAGEYLNGGDYPGHLMVSYGFDLPTFGYVDPDPEDFATLEAEWTRAIEERRAQSADAS